MADKTGIEWTDATWNPIIGCSVVSPGCTNCYAMAQSARIVRMTDGMRRSTPYAAVVRETNGKAVWNGVATLIGERLLEPLRWRRPRTIFVNSMGDLFHEAVSDEWIDQVFAVMALAPQHTFQVLTKRSARMREYCSKLRDRSLEIAQRAVWLGIWDDPDIAAGDVIAALDPGFLPNVWLGVSAEDQRRADERVPDLLATPAAVRFVSAEPLLGPIDFDEVIPNPMSWNPVHGIERTLDWIIVGGESGPNARPMHPAWARSIRDQCKAVGVAFFFKQWGEWTSCGDWYQAHPVSLPIRAWEGAGWTDRPELVAPDTEWVARLGKARAGRFLDGVEHNDMPTRAQ